MADYELVHYGIKGQKWGIRRYQNADGSLTPAGKKRQARRYTKELNSLDKKQSEALANVIRSDMKYMKRAASAENYIKKHNDNPSQRNVDILRKKRMKMVDAGEERNAYAKKYKELNSESWNKIVDFANKGYTVSSKEVTRMTKVGEQYTTYALTGPIGYLATNSAQFAKYGERYQATLKDGRSINQTPWIVRGYNYKVT